jgi:hypothetical protein
MRATYGGVNLSSALFAPGETWLTTFRIQGQQTNQIRRPARAEWIKPIARGHRSHSIDIVLRPPPFADVDAAAEALALFFSDLPQQGDLVLLSGGRERTFPDACVDSFNPPPRNGVSLEYPIKFIAGSVTTRTLSTLATMDARYPNVISLTGLTGGTEGDLDGQQTLDIAAGRMVNFYLNEGGVLQPHQWVLVLWTDETEDAEDGRVLPDDFHATTNPKIWRRIV